MIRYKIVLIWQPVTLRSADYATYREAVSAADGHDVCAVASTTGHAVQVHGEVDDRELEKIFSTTIAVGEANTINF